MAALMKSSLVHAAQFRAVLVGLLILGATVGTTEAVTKGIFVFGDSLADAGNNDYSTYLLTPKANFFPYGESYYFPDRGRFSNGRLVPDFLASFLSLPFAPPYQQPSLNPFRFFQGANFASAGSGILDTTSQNQGVIPLSTQIQEFQGLVAGLNFFSPQTINTSLYVFTTGSNDLNTYFSNATLQATTPINVFLQQLAGSLAAQIQIAINAGARKIVVGGLGPIGCVPAIVAQASPLTQQCYDPLNQYAKTFNQFLLGYVIAFNQAGVSKVVFGNTYDYVLGIVQNGASQGFTYKSTACCGFGTFNGGLPQCGILFYNLCSDPQNHVFWDLFHPTEKVNQNLANLLWTGGTAFAYPINVSTLTSLY